jgi:hypothetical protein
MTALLLMVVIYTVLGGILSVLWLVWQCHALRFGQRSREYPGDAGPAEKPRLVGLKTTTRVHRSHRKGKVLKTSALKIDIHI